MSIKMNSSYLSCDSNVRFSEYAYKTTNTHNSYTQVFYNRKIPIMIITQLGPSQRTGGGFLVLVILFFFLFFFSFSTKRFSLKKVSTSLISWDQYPNIPNSTWIYQYPNFREVISQYPRKYDPYPNIPNWLTPPIGGADTLCLQKSWIPIGRIGIF